MPDVALRNSTTSGAPKDYPVPASQEVLLKAVIAHIDGSGAAGAFLPALQLLDPSGNVMWTATQAAVAAGASAECSWFPHVGGGSSGGGGGSGLFWPAANQGHSALDTTTYADTPDGAGLLDTLVIDGAQTVVTGAHAYLGDAHPYMISTGYSVNQTAGGFWFGDGSQDPWAGAGRAGFLVTNNNATHVVYPVLFGNGHVLLEGAAPVNGPTDLLNMTGAALQSQQGGAGNVQMWAGIGAPTIGGQVGDIYFRQDGGTSVIYVCTVAGVAGSATWATITGGGGGGGQSFLTGRINANGTIAGGSGFTCVRNAVGDYTITFSSAYATTPTVVATGLASGGASLVELFAVSTTSFEVITFDSAFNDTDRPWHFLATATV